MIKKSMIGLFLVGLISASLLFTTACQKKVEAPTGPTEAEIEAQKAAEAAAAKKAADARAAAEREAAAAKAAAERAAAEAKRAAAAAAKEAVESEKIYFDYDSSELKSEAQDILTRKATWLKANGNYKLKIEGNCDERGSTEYNLALGSRRAEAAAKFINALGISEDRLTTISYGEDRPAVDGNDESAWSQNRRDEFVLIQ
jgi:peptidoglycan-associated lipoprotein